MEIPISNRKETSGQLEASSVEGASQHHTRESLPNSAMAGCYLSGILIPLMCLSTATLRRNDLLRFHCFQCLVLFCVWIPLYFLHVGRFQPIINVLSLFCLVAWITAIAKAWRGKTFRIPAVSILAEWLADRPGLKPSN